MILFYTMEKRKYVQHCYECRIHTQWELASEAHCGKAKQEEETQSLLKIHPSLSLSHFLTKSLKQVCENLVMTTCIYIGKMMSIDYCLDNWSTMITG